jgi:hypothetical protein
MGHGKGFLCVWSRERRCLDLLFLHVLNPICIWCMYCIFLNGYVFCWLNLACMRACVRVSARPCARATFRWRRGMRMCRIPRYMAVTDTIDKGTG